MVNKKTLLIFIILISAIALVASFVVLKKEATTPPVLTLQEHLNKAKPGDVIEFSGKVIGPIITTVAGTADKPITLRGVDSALIKGESTGSKKGLTIFHDNYIIENIKIESFEKGLWIESASNVIVDNLTINDIGHEGVKIRRGSTYVTIKNTTVGNTGQTNPIYGQGFFVGDSSNNWLDIHTPDTSSYITFENCNSINAGSNGFDFKEGSSNIKVINSTVQNPAQVSFYTRANNIQFINATSIGNQSGNPAFKLYQVDVNKTRYGYNIELKAIKVDKHKGSIVRFHRKDIAKSSSLYNDYQANKNGISISADQAEFWGSSTIIAVSDASNFIENIFKNINTKNTSVNSNKNYIRVDYPKKLSTEKKKQSDNNILYIWLSLTVLIAILFSVLLLFKNRKKEEPEIKEEFRHGIYLMLDLKGSEHNISKLIESLETNLIDFLQKNNIHYSKNYQFILDGSEFLVNVPCKKNKHELEIIRITYHLCISFLKQNNCLGNNIVSFKLNGIDSGIKREDSGEEKKQKVKELIENEANTTLKNIVSLKEESINNMSAISEEEYDHLLGKYNDELE